MPRTLFIAAAVAQELAGLRRAFPFVATAPGRWEATVDGAPVRLSLTGVGFPQAHRAARELADLARPGDFVLSTGYCGALAPGPARGSIAVSASVVTCGTDRPPVVVTVDAPAFLLPAANPGVIRVRSLTAPRIVNEPTEREHSRCEHGADVVDMESGILVEACRERGVSCGISRVVLDTPAAPLRVDYNSIPAPQGHLRPWDVVRWLLRRPWKLFALLADRRAAGDAALVLGEYLESVARAFSAEARKIG